MPRALQLQIWSGDGPPPPGTLAQAELGFDKLGASLYSSTDGADIVALAGSAALPANVVTGTPNGIELEIVGALPSTPDANTIYFIT